MFKLFSKPVARVTPTKVAALKVFCVVRHVQRGVASVPHKVRCTARDVADAWSESGRIVPNE